MHVIPTYVYNTESLKTKPVHAQGQHLGRLFQGSCLLEQNCVILEMSIV